MSDQARHQYEDFLQQLPCDWQRVEIRQLGAVVGGGTPSREVPSYWQGTIPWVTPGEVSGAVSQLLHDTQEHISPVGLSGSGANLLPAGSLLVTTRATLGARIINAVPMATNQGFKSIVFKNPEEGGYYYHLLKKVKPELIRRASGTTFLEISGAEFGSIQVPNPPAPEKKAIVQILDTLGTAIRETEALIDKLKAIKQGLLHDLLTRGIDANGQLRPPQSEAPQLYKESPLGWIPREWKFSTVGDEFEVQLGKMLDAQKNSGAMKPYLGNKAVQWDHIDLNEVQQMALSIADMERFRLRPGDLLVCEGGDVGRAAIWEGQLDECYYQKALHRLRPVHGFSARLMLELLRYWMSRDVLFEYISKTSIAHFTQEKFASVPLPVPSTDEQNRLVSVVLAHKQRQEQEEDALKKLMEEKQGLMNDLLTGRVRVTPLLAASS